VNSVSIPNDDPFKKGLRRQSRNVSNRSTHGKARPDAAIFARIRFSASAPQYRQSSVIKTEVYGTVIVVFKISTL